MSSAKSKSSGKSHPPYAIELSPAAAKQIRHLDKPFQKQVVRRIEQLATDPRPHGVESIQGAQEIYRIRSGNYRIIYTINDQALLVLVVKVGDRKEVYRHI